MAFKDQESNQSPIVKQYHCEYIGKLFEKVLQEQTTHQTKDQYGLTEIFEKYLKSDQYVIVKDCLESIEQFQESFMDNTKRIEDFENHINKLSEN